MNTPLPKILILGGTEFVGRQLVEQLLEQGEYEVYLFNRGKTNPNIFPKANHIIGDRETDDVEKINQHRWDFVVDFSSYFPGSLQRTLDNINRDVKKYIYISTISVYSMTEYDGQTPLKEDCALKIYKPSQLTEPSLKFYGEKKVACEDIINQTEWLSAIVLRPSVIYGKFDPTNRLYYWIDRIRNRNNLILPQHGDYQISLTYALDLIETIMLGLKGSLKAGAYNCVADQPFHFRETLGLIRSTLKTDCTFVPADIDWLRSKGLSGKDFPLWYGASILVDNSKLRDAAEPSFSSPQNSILQTIEHYKHIGWPTPGVGISYEDEDKLGFVKSS